MDAWVNEKNASTLIGIDPGSSHMGIAIFYIDPTTYEIIRTISFSVDAKGTIYYNRPLADTLGERYARIDSMVKALEEILEEYKPFMVACETPYFNRFTPGAFSVLTETCFEIRKTVYRYLTQCPFLGVKPVLAKKAVKASGHAKKDVMYTKVSEMKDTLRFHGDLSILDEHAIDALAIGYYAYLHLCNTRKSVLTYYQELKG